MLFPTSLVGSYPQPDWLIDRARLARRFPGEVIAVANIARAGGRNPSHRADRRRTMMP